MIRRALIALVTGTAMLAWPLAAAGQSYNQSPAATMPPPTAATNTPQNTDTKTAKPTDDDSDSAGTVIQAGPDAGQVIGRHHHAKKMTTDGESKAPPKDSQCTQPCV